MSSQRLLQHSVRRLALQHPSAFNSSNAIAPLVTFAFTRRCLSASRSVRSPTPSAAEETSQVLIKQRLYRPVSPHLGIYRPQITWILSILNRITGSVLSGGFYVFGALYLVAPVLGWSITSAAMVAGVAKWPVALKIGAKLGLALPFTFHCINGIRHIVWDLGAQLTNKQVITTGWAVVGLTIVSSLGLLLL